MQLLRLRFTVVFLIVMLVANLLASGLGQDLPAAMLKAWGVGHDSLLAGDAFRLITGTFLSHDTAMLIRQFFFAAIVIGYTEWLRGSTQTALLFFGLDIVGTLLLLVFVGLGAEVIDVTALNDVGMSIGGFGLIGVALTRWRTKWLLLAVTLIAITIKLTLAPELLADVGHALALLLGFVVGQGLLLRDKRREGEKNGANFL